MKHLHLPDGWRRCLVCGAELIFVPQTAKRAAYWRPRRRQR